MSSSRSKSHRVLDLFCCQGGAGEGYRQAGFDVVGIDVDAQPRNPHEFIQDDALEYVFDLLHGNDTGGWWLQHFDAIHASPPCQGYSKTQRIQDNDHPKLIEPLRELLEQTGLPYVIENVPGAPLRDPVELCGGMFGMRLYRHRLFETNWRLTPPRHRPHVARQVKMGRQPQPDEFIQPVGNFSNVALAREVMEMPWASREGLREAIPPAYTRFIGSQLMAHIARQEATSVAA